MLRRLVSMLLLIAAFFTCIDPAWCGSIIGQVTLHITLYVSPKPVTAETEPGVYSGYTVAKADEMIFITAD